MALSDDDVSEILRIVDETELDELRVETDGLSLHLVKRGTAPAAEPEPNDTEQDDQSPQRGDGVVIEAPMLGVFYRAPSPGAPPFVELGTRVEAETTVCIIEVMKMMNSVLAEVAGTIVEIHAENAELVEQGQPLFRVEPA